MNTLIYKITKLRKEGKTIDYISKELKISKTKLEKLIKGNNIPNNLFNFKDPLIVENVKNLLKSKNYSTQKEISKILDIESYQLNKIIKLNKLEKYINFKNESYPTTLWKNYKSLPEEVKKKKIKAVSDLKKKYKNLLVEYKGGKCIKCGYNKCIEALEFHHLNPEEKSFSLGSNSRSLDIQKKEADKCILVCSNCHREIHYMDGLP